MSMNLNASTTPAAHSEPNRAWYFALARYTRIRREQLGLSIRRAAELSGMDLAQWWSLEDGWVPEDMNMIRSIAATLEIRWSDYSVLAFLASVHQDCR